MTTTKTARVQAPALGTDAARRHFLKSAGALSLAGTAGGFALNLATIGAASAAGPDYKALVCVFLYGGNDGQNTVIPYDTAGYATYAARRGVLALAQTDVTPLTPITPLPGGRQVAVHNALAPLAALFQARRCAVVANVGPLIVPTSRATYTGASVPLPAKLFSHNDQQSTWQASAPEGARYGWGGRIGDLLAASNGNQVFTCNSITGNAVFLSGQSIQPYALDASAGAVPVNGVTAATLFGSAAGPAALRATLTATQSSMLQGDLRGVNQRSIDAQGQVSAALAAAPALATPFPTGNTLATQLQMVARLISARAALGASRQVFLVSLGGFDTHSDQINAQATLLGQVAAAIDAFDRAMIELGTSNQVTLFTASDFGRALLSNGNGSDHGWGSHHFVLGGAVAGGQVYGSFPDLTANVPTDAGNGRLIPTTSVEQYAATMAAWMGVAASDLPLILPKVVNFPSRTLGFMG